MAWGSSCQAIHNDVGHLQRNQEEGDTTKILHALDATANGAPQLQTHSPDKDVFVIALWRYTELCKNTLFVTGRVQQHRLIELKPTVQTLGPEKIAVLSALSGAHNTGCFLERESSSAGKYLQWRIHPLSLPLQTLGKQLIRMK